MLKRFTNRPWLMLGAGLTMGLLVGLGMVIGSLVGANYASRTAPTEIPLHAMATHGTENMAMATMPISEGMEGLVTLDFITGELSVFCLSGRTGAFTLGGKTNVLTDLKVEKGKKVNFLLVTGGAAFIRGGATLNPAPSAIYVCNANTGAFVAYGMAFNATTFAQGTPTEVAIKKLDVGIATSLGPAQ